MPSPPTARRRSRRPRSPRMARCSPTALRAAARTGSRSPSATWRQRPICPTRSRGSSSQASRGPTTAPGSSTRATRRPRRLPMSRRKAPRSMCSFTTRFTTIASARTRARICECSATTRTPRTWSAPKSPTTGSRSSSRSRTRASPSTKSTLCRLQTPRPQTPSPAAWRSSASSTTLTQGSTFFSTTALSLCS
eukprot:Amastigsp_a843470_16.p4 type:complete len:193 gc:universal Amastigsp_a843470_16:384-962(+)